MKSSEERFAKIIFDHFECMLLHEKQSYWDGTYKLDPTTNRMVENIFWVCKECKEASDY